jgi:hypothetical protein
MSATQHMQVTPTDNNRVQVSWLGTLTPDAIDGLKVSYCNDGMLFLGPIDTPVRFKRLVERDGIGHQAIELELSLAGLEMLKGPRRQVTETGNILSLQR